MSRDVEASREANDLWFGAPEWADPDETEDDEPPEPELDPEDPEQV